MKRVLVRFYSRFDTYLNALVKFCAAFGMLYLICDRMGADSPLNDPLIMVIVAAFCSFLPGNAMILAGTVYLEAELLCCSVEAGIVGGILLFLMLLLYYSFIPGQAYMVILAAALVSLKVPFAVVMAGALLTGPSGIAGMVFGIGISSFAETLSRYQGGNFELSEEMLGRIAGLAEQLYLQRDLILTIVVLSSVYLVIYVLRRMPVSYSWYVAVFSGLSGYLLLVITGRWLLAMPLWDMMMIPDVLLGLLTGLVLRYFCFRLDYKKVEFLQFEDDDYYYYVKAVAKLDAVKEDGKDEQTDRVDLE